MKYLLDVSALVALGFHNHVFHNRVTDWLQKQEVPVLATCSITELGFVRVLSQAPGYGFDVNQARSTLLRLKKTKVLTFLFIEDRHGIAQLPDWVKHPKQITDGHLVELAKVNQAVLATLDEKIPGSYRIA